MEKYDKEKDQQREGGKKERGVERLERTKCCGRLTGQMENQRHGKRDRQRKGLRKMENRERSYEDDKGEKLKSKEM